MNRVLRMLTSVHQFFPWRGRSFTALDIRSEALSLGSSARGYQMLRPFKLVSRYSRELKNSIRFELNLLPRQPPAITGVEITVRYIPMMGVSGDYYDFLRLGEGQLGLAIGDAPGGGMGAALLVSSMCTALRASVQANPTAIEELLGHLNWVVRRNAPDQFPTLTYGIWDSRKNSFTYSSAGHLPVLLYQSATGRVRKLEAGGVILGVLESIDYPTETVSLDPGDALVFYTDGITEASNASGMFGVDGLSEVVAANGDRPSEALATAILDAALEFSHQRWQDDVTLMVMKRTPTDH